MNHSEASSGVSRQTDSWKSKALLPMVAYSLLGTLLFLKLPSLFRFPFHVHANSGAVVSPRVAAVPGQPLGGGIYAPRPANRLIAQAGTHVRVDGWLDIHDSKLSVRDVIVLLDGKPLAKAYIYPVPVDRSSGTLHCEWSVEPLFAGIAPGDHHLQAAVFLADGSGIQFDDKSITVLD